MPSGQTHDRITLWSLPVITGLSLILTYSSRLTLLVSGGFLFSGLMFGPDLDLYSLSFKRWGWLRWIWLPYQQMVRHRSMLSHGLLIGTSLRLLYLASWIIGLVVLTLPMLRLFRDMSSWQRLAEQIISFLRQHPLELLALFVGLEIGAMLHAGSDWTHSAYKRYQKQRKKLQGRPSGSTVKKRTAQRRRNSVGKAGKSR